MMPGGAEMTATSAAGVQATRDAWTRTVDSLIADVAGWCREQNWPCRRLPTRLRDGGPGEYTVPALLLQVELAQLMFQPDPADPADGTGLVRFYHLPMYDDLAFLVWADGRWQYYRDRDWPAGGADLSRPSPITFGRDLFVAEVNRMVAHGRQHAA
jgi:hypothetical protein